MADTVFAQGEQKRACPHGTKATPDLADYADTSDVGRRWCRSSVRWMLIAGDGVIVVGVS